MQVPPASAAGKGEPLACERVSSPRISSPDSADPERGRVLVELQPFLKVPKGILKRATMMQIIGP